MSDDPTPYGPPAGAPRPIPYGTAGHAAYRVPPVEDVFGSAETLMTRFTAQLTVQLAHLRPFPEPLTPPLTQPRNPPPAPPAPPAAEPSARVAAVAATPERA